MRQATLDFLRAVRDRRISSREVAYADHAIRQEEQARERRKAKQTKPLHVEIEKVEVTRANGRKAAGKVARRERVAAIREAVLVRAEGKCEWCGGPFHTWGGPELHHVVSGSGRRRVHESEATCTAICFVCHRAVHASDPGILGFAAKWADRRGFREAYAEIERRSAKARAAQAERGMT